jgi:hypothetical protein
MKILKDVAALPVAESLLSQSQECGHDSRKIAGSGIRSGMGLRHDAGLGTAGAGRCPDDRQLRRPGVVRVQRFQFELRRRGIHLFRRRFVVVVEFDRR